MKKFNSRIRKTKRSTKGGKRMTAKNTRRSRGKVSGGRKGLQRSRGKVSGGRKGLQRRRIIGGGYKLSREKIVEINEKNEKDMNAIVDAYNKWEKRKDEDENNEDQDKESVIAALTSSILEYSDLLEIFQIFGEDYLKDKHLGKQYLDKLSSSYDTSGSMYVNSRGEMIEFSEMTKEDLKNWIKFLEVGKDFNVGKIKFLLLINDYILPNIYK